MRVSSEKKKKNMILVFVTSECIDQQSEYQFLSTSKCSGVMGSPERRSVVTKDRRLDFILSLSKRIAQQ